MPYVYTCSRRFSAPNSVAISRRSPTPQISLSSPPLSSQVLHNHNHLGYTTHFRCPTRNCYQSFQPGSLQDLTEGRFSGFRLLQEGLPKISFFGSQNVLLPLTSHWNPVFVNSSLEKNIIPTYELMKSFFQSDEKTLYCIVTCPYVFMGDRLAQNVKMLVDEGVSYATIGYMFRTRASVLLSHDLRKAVDEVKELGFDPSKILFGIALMAKTAVHKSRWNAKVDAFKSWGWSAEAISEAFRRQPLYMLTSKDKINEVMRLWVNQLGWNSLALVKRPEIFGFSLERRIIPRAFVLQYLLAKGLRDKNCSLYTPFCISEKLFLKKFVECFTEERSQLLKIYQEKKEY